jgi:beta-xylosidase
LKGGDFAGLSLLQKLFGQVGVQVKNGKKVITMVSANTGKPVLIEEVPLEQNQVYLKASCDFTELKDTAVFFYSLDGKNWTKIGEPLKMKYTLPHFMGYRFGLFNYATKEIGGYADFDYFRISKDL